MVGDNRYARFPQLPTNLKEDEFYRFAVGIPPKKILYLYKILKGVKPAYSLLFAGILLNFI